MGCRLTGWEKDPSPFTLLAMVWTPERMPRQRIRQAGWSTHWRDVPDLPEPPEWDDRRSKLPILRRSNWTSVMTTGLGTKMSGMK